METSDILEYVFGKDVKAEHLRPSSGPSFNLDQRTSYQYPSLSEGLDKALEAAIYHGPEEGAVGFDDERAVEVDCRHGRLGPALVRFDMRTHVGQFVMDRDRLTLISHSNFSSIRANVCLYEGKWQYEVQLASKGVMQVGWATVNCTFSQESGVGDTAKSFAYDGNRQRKWNVLTAHYGEPWLGGDIIGCTLDLHPSSSNHGTVEFFRNGHSMGVAFSDVPMGRGEAYFPAVSMAFSESLVANFGATPFRHPIPGFQPIQQPPLKKLAHGRVLLRWFSRLISLLPKSPEGTIGECRPEISSGHSKEEVKSKEKESRSPSASMLWVSSLVLHRLGPLLNSAFVVQAVLVPFMEELTGSLEDTGPHYHLSKLLDLFWIFLEEHEIFPMLENVALSLLCSFLMTPSPQQTKKAIESPTRTGLLELFKDQHRSLNLLLELTRHQQTRRHLLLHVFFSRIGFFSFINMKPLDEEALVEVVKKPWFDRLPSQKNSLEESKILVSKARTSDDPGDKETYSEYLDSIQKMEKAIKALEKKQVEFLKLLMSNDDGTSSQPSSRHIFLKKFHKYLEEVFATSRLIPLLVTPVTTSLCLFQRLVSVFQMLWKEEVCLGRENHSSISSEPTLEKFYMRSKYFYNGSIDLFGSDRLGGVPSHLMKQFREELMRADVPQEVVSSYSSSPSLFNPTSGASSRMTSLVNLFQRRLHALGVERGAISEALLPTPDPATDNPLDAQSSMTGLLRGFPTSVRPMSGIDQIGRRRRLRNCLLEIDYSEEKEENLGIGPVDTVVSLLDLFNSIVLLYQLQAHKQLSRISTIHEKMNEYATAFRMATGRLSDCRARIAGKVSSEQDMEEELLVEKELVRSVEVFEQKLNSHARDLAWVKACIFSKSKQSHIAWMLRSVLRTLQEASSPSSVPSTSSQASTSSSFDESSALEDQRRLFAFVPDYYLDALVGLCTALRIYFHPTAPIDDVEDHEELLYQVGLFLCNHFYDSRIVHASSKDTLVQALAALFCAPPALKALEKLPSASLEGLVRSLLRPYENRAWAQSNFILVRIWQGNGFAFRYTRSPHLSNRIGPRLNAPEGPGLSGPGIGPCIDPCPTEVFQKQVGRLLEVDEPLATAFINSLLNQLNWAFSEFIGMLQEIQNVAGRSNNQVFIESRELKICATCFDLALCLLRVLEMVTVVAPQVFTDASRPSSDLLLSRLCQLLCQVLNRVACAPGNGNGTTIGPGCFSHVVNLDISDLELVDHFPMLAAVAGVLLGLLTPEIKDENLQPPAKGSPLGSIPRVTEAILSEPSFQIGSLHFLLGGPESFEEADEVSHGGAAGGAARFAFSFANFPTSVSKAEIAQLKDAVRWLTRWQDVLSAEANSKSRIPEEELCTICYAFPATATFYPCKHTSCSRCIVHHVMNHKECFFCKASIESVVDALGQVIHRLPPEKKGD